jgi:cell cycle sensor histidine kinase DivJ
MIVGQAGGGLRELVGASGQLLVSLDERGRVLGLYGHAPKGVASAELLGRDLAAAAGPAGRAAVQDGLRAALRNGWSETGFQPAGDASGWVVATLRRLDDGRIGGALRDGRAQHAREADLVRARETAEAQNAGKSRFLANMSHELRTPLNAIMGFSDIMKQRLFGPLPDRYGEYAELIHESGSHLLELINDVLDMSKIEAERFELAREEFDARDAVSAVLRLMRGQADRAGVHLRGVLPKDPLDADADRRAVKQIVLNLISNALKFTPRDGAVTVTAQAVGAMLEIVVSDTGVGIAAEDVARLGRPYEQAGGVDQRQAGTGLGLSLVRAFAELHGGEMTLESALGEGTSVTVRLPVLVDAKPVQAPAAAE